MPGGLVIGLTGATGHIGGRLLARLAAMAEVAELRSVARRPLAVGQVAGSCRMTHVEADVASPAARDALAGADIVYHLAAQVWEGRGDKGMTAMHRANVTGTANVAGADIGALVLASSVAVYGARPTNPLPMTEQHPARPNAECTYAQHKLLAEMACREMAQRCAVARLSAVLGPNADIRVARAIGGFGLAVPAVRGVAQAVQWMDEEDAVDGLLALGGALLDGRPGVGGEVFNLAPPGWLGADDVARLSGGRVLELPRGVLMRGARWGRMLGLSPFGEDRAVLIDGPLAVSPAKAEAVLGWRASSSSSEVLAEALRRGARGAPLNRRRP